MKVSRQLPNIGRPVTASLLLAEVTFEQQEAALPGSRFSGDVEHQLRLGAMPIHFARLFITVQV